MAIDRIPGVGPQNSDIAAAVAAPSAATIAAAVAAPSAATIAAAVAAPSAATIATQVAASVPTLAQITSTVQANAGSPFGGSWTQITTGSLNNTGISFTDISGLGGYKRLRFIFWNLTQNVSGPFYFRPNGDGSNSQFYQYYSGNWDNAWPSGSTGGDMSNLHVNSSTTGSYQITFYNADSTTSFKDFDFDGYGPYAGYENTKGPIYGKGVFRSNSAITYLRVSNRGNGFLGGSYAVFGGN
jgi:hypothetical protein